MPVALRRKLKLKPHDRVIIESAADCITIRPAPDFFALGGVLGKALSPEEEQQAIEDEAVARYRRSQG